MSHATMLIAALLLASHLMPSTVLATNSGAEKDPGDNDTLKELGPEYAQSAQILEQNPELYVLWAFDPVRGPSGYITNVNITKEDVPGGITIDDYLEASVNGLPPHIQMVDREVVSVGAFEAGKLVLGSDIQGLKGLSVVYAIREGNRFWKVTYSTDAAEFVERTPTWEQSIRTFRLDT